MRRRENVSSVTLPLHALIPDAITQYVSVRYVVRQNYFCLLETDEKRSGLKAFCMWI